MNLPVNYPCFGRFTFHIRRNIYEGYITEL